MEEQCFYCQGLLENVYYYGQIIQQGDHIEKPLCKECYHEWLEGMKG
ncbi:hypothetical protein [Pseudalkalibacillus caeni]|nr:hypothetical protein [Pseudalkalibacillus caeni]